MDTLRCLGALALGLALAGCSDDRFALAPGPDSPAKAQDHSSGVVVQVKGTADHLRTVGDVTALTLFSFDSQRKADGTTTGPTSTTSRRPGSQWKAGDLYLDRR